MKDKKYRIMEIDTYLQPYETDIQLRMSEYEKKKESLLGGEKGKTLSDFANGYLYYGIQPARGGWYYREWAPGADSVSLMGDFNGWNKESHPLKPVGNGNWEIFIPDRKTIAHKSFVKAWVTANGTGAERVPAYIRRAVQDPDTGIFCGQVWHPARRYKWKDEGFAVDRSQPPMIYESHVGMGSEREGIGTYREFMEDVLPRVKQDGYNTIQLMAIMEHPYYASFGYQVSSFFAASSRFGTPEELKALVDRAHALGIAVLLDIVHSHAAINVGEGLNLFDGTEYQYFHQGAKGNHPAWGTKLFNYAKPEVLHFLLSNVKFWMEEYHFDGFRFDGVTSMLYQDHGLGQAFDSYEKYFSLNTDVDAINYLQLANELIKEVRPDSISIAEDMSGLPGIALPVPDGGVGFDYRLSMGVPDFWVKTVSKEKDENWNLGKMWYELTTRRPGEANIGYCESHDQALVGDKTLIFWLADKEMYWSMNTDSRNLVIDRAVALHKMIRLLTATLAGEGYLNFMGNEFGHPEWIDFPREGNHNSYQYARRQWSLSDNPFLRYKHLGDFDKAMVALITEAGLIGPGKYGYQLLCHEADKLLCYTKEGHGFLFNFHPTKMQEGLVLPVPPRFRKAKLVLATDWKEFGGFRDREEVIGRVVYKQQQNRLETTLYPRTAQVFRLEE